MLGSRKSVASVVSRDIVEKLLQIAANSQIRSICAYLAEIRAGQKVLVSSCSGDMPHWEGAEPNKITCDYYEQACSK